jgi:hypothetical protein
MAQSYVNQRGTGVLAPVAVYARTVQWSSEDERGPRYGGDTAWLCTVSSGPSDNQIRWLKVKGRSKIRMRPARTVHTVIDGKDLSRRREATRTI